VARIGLLARATEPWNCGESVGIGAVTRYTTVSTVAKSPWHSWSDQRAKSADFVSRRDRAYNPQMWLPQTGQPELHSH